MTTPSRTSGKVSTRLLVLLGVGVLVVVMGVAGVAFCMGGPAYYSAKYSSVSPAIMPTAVPVAFAAEVQTERHTCGLHSVRTIYRAYGIDPDAADLRFRLGTDKPGHNFDPESLGTIHPDITRVMRQDGFDVRVILRPTEGDGAEMRAHLAAGFPVLTLVRVKGLHWIVLAEGHDGKSRIFDSLKEDVEEVDSAEFIRTRVISAILVKPTGFR
jgi:ABC-type bacteriocin/lantibiotic exporter with double-glycine peptidase domain